MSLAIVTITRNDLAGLRRTLASVAAQTTAPDEHWIIDGASTDGTREFLATLPPRPGLRILSEPDAGIYDAMNKGVARAAADYVWFLNSGDSCASPDIVATLVAALRSPSPVDVLYGKVLRSNRHGLRSVGGPVRARDFRVQMPVCHQAIVYRRAVLLAHPYPTEFRLISDWIVTRRLFASGASTRYLDRDFAIYDLAGRSSLHRFAILREKLRHDRRPLDRLHIVLVAGTHATALWLAHRTGLYDFHKRRQHRART
ncbi:MAG: glycosyltransferase [Opitutaceae bacterium]|jgi:putative colanic acid biosynthesis glycosyltransferase|nr:glycosyltransferase [Opitutaceae bacterium]